jgi:hypothetical protein
LHARTPTLDGRVAGRRRPEVAGAAARERDRTPVHTRPDILLVALCRPWTAGRHRPAGTGCDRARRGVIPVTGPGGAVWSP